ncbi:MAG: DUF4340 domain-containing protein [Kiritimatiellia bacterium]|nr:DUF4340 domain-containing protein [Kiritimatiellia bacterium]
MNQRTLLRILIACAVLFGFVFLRIRWLDRTARPETGGRPGDPVVRLDVNAVARIEVAKNGQAVVVERSGNRWILSRMHGYPADSSKVADRLIRLSQMTVGQVIRGGENFLPEFGLAPLPEEERLTPVENPGQPLAVTLSDSAGRTLWSMKVGGFRRSAASLRDPMQTEISGQYIQGAEGDVILLGELAPDFSPEGLNWLDSSLTRIAAEEVIAVQAEGSNRTLRLTAERGGWKAQVEEQAMEWADSLDARRLAGALRYLRMAGVADPALPDEVTGMNEADRFEYRTRSGLRIEAKVGREAAETGNVYFRITADFDPARISPSAEKTETGEEGLPALPGEKIKEQKIEEAKFFAAAAKERLSPWLFMVGSHHAADFRVSRDHLIQSVAEEKP